MDSSQSDESSVAVTNRTVRTVEDLLAMLDQLFDTEADRWTARGGSDWWDGFYNDRDRDVPFFRPVPDESLVAWHRGGKLNLPGGARALDLGCGPGRNAVWLAQQGFHVDALDLSPAALEWGQERAHAAGVEVNFVRTSIFNWHPSTAYDLVYDSGCFHHLPPHRRISYRALLERTLRPDGAFGLACFAAGAMGSEEPDVSFYREGGLFGGLAYTDVELRSLFDWLQEVELRRMQAVADGSDVFGEPFLWAALFRRSNA